MAPFKKDLTPLSKGGAIHKHQGKGSHQAPMAVRNSLPALSVPPTNSINNFAKATPMPSGPSPVAPAAAGPGSGDFAGIGG